MTMKEKRDMDILQWWNQYESRFPIVAQMARDIYLCRFLQLHPSQHFQRVVGLLKTKDVL